MSSDSKFKRGQTLRERGTEITYVVVCEPESWRKAFGSEESYYTIRSYGLETDHVFWTVPESYIGKLFKDAKETQSL